MPSQSPKFVQPPPELPAIKDTDPLLTNYLRTFSLWSKKSLDGKLDDKTGLPGILIQSADTPPGAIPKVYRIEITVDGILQICRMELGSGADTDDFPVFPEAPADGGSYVRKDGAWVPAVPAAGGTFTGDITAPNITATGVLAAATATLAGLLTGVTATFSGALSAASAAFTGAVTTASLSVVTVTLTGLLTGVAATFTGLLTLGAGVTFTTLPPLAATDAAAATAGVPVGGVYRNGSILMVRVA